MAGKPPSNNNNSEDEDCCVYTYKGDRAADLPSSFFDFCPPNGAQRNQNEPNSPDMDFLEMDFDPGGAFGGREQGDEPLSELAGEELDGRLSPEMDQSFPPPNYPPLESPQACCSKTLQQPPPKQVQRLVKSLTLPDIVKSSCAIVLSNSDPSIRPSEDETQTIDVKIEGAMVWTLQEAFEKSVGQIGVSACGASAVSDVIASLGLQGAEVSSCVETRLRDETADLPEYLLSRSRAGSTHEDLIRGMELATSGAVFGRFFRPGESLTPNSLLKFLLKWMCRGAVPVLTLNLQRIRDSTETPDAWHHQMVFGVGQEGLYMTNPVGLVGLGVLLPQLISPSVLKVRRQDVVSRKGPRTDLKKLARFQDPTWNELNVLGQVSNLLLEELPIFNGSSVAKRVRSSHITIPASYRSGITLFIPRASPNHTLLKSAQEL